MIKNAVAYPINDSWPDPENPGLPLEPTKKRCHFVVHPVDFRTPDSEMAVYWNGTHYLHPGSAVRYQPLDMVAYRYIGPCIIPGKA